MPSDVNMKGLPTARPCAEDTTIGVAVVLCMASVAPMGVVESAVKEIGCPGTSPCAPVVMSAFDDGATASSGTTLTGKTAAGGAGVPVTATAEPHALDSLNVKAVAAKLALHT